MLHVCSLSETMRLTWETSRMCCQRLPRLYNTASRLRVSRQLGISGAACAMKFDNLTFHGHIRVLLIKTNSMVYICYVKYKICEKKT